MRQDYQYIVCTECVTYNHAPYIVDAMNGFTMQKTTFPVVNLIVDDASSDGEQDIIREYLRNCFLAPFHTEQTDDFELVCANHKTNNNCTFAVYFLKYNHYQSKKTKIHYFTEWETKTKYVAMCEGDDYWLDPNKLQKQFELLESNQDYSMVCNRTKLLSVRKNRFIGENYCYNKSRIVDPKDVINRTGLFISTCSIFYRSVIKVDMPSYCAKCKVGDYPLQILCAMRGLVYYMDDIMSVYRVQNSNSWMGRQQWGSALVERCEVIKSQVAMFKGFAIDYPKYSNILKNKVSEHINRNVPNRLAKKSVVEKYLSVFTDEIEHYSMTWKIDLWFRRCRIPLVREVYTRLFLRKYFQRKILY